MRLDSSRRALLLLLGCLVTALVFPRACADSRVGFGVLLPATAPLTAADERNAREAELLEANARLAQELHHVHDRLEALPSELSAALAATEFVGAPAQALTAVAARVLHRDVSRSRLSFVVDVGSNADIYRGLAVVHGNSLVGVVQAVADDACRVVRVDDPARDNVFPAEIRPVGAGDALGDGLDLGDRTLRQGVARGTGDGHVVVTHLGEGAAKVGDLVVTGATRIGVPAGLVLGEVVRFDDDDRDGVWEAQVRPLRDLETLRSVIIYVRPQLDRVVRPRDDAR